MLLTHVYDVKKVIHHCDKRFSVYSARCWNLTMLGKEHALFLTSLYNRPGPLSHVLDGWSIRETENKHTKTVKFITNLNTLLCFGKKKKKLLWRRLLSFPFFGSHNSSSGAMLCFVMTHAPHDACTIWHTWYMCVLRVPCVHGTRSALVVALLGNGA